MSIYLQVKEGLDTLPHAVIVLFTTVFPLSKILSHFARKHRFNQDLIYITNSLYTRIPMAIVDCVELALNVGYERIWFSEIRVEF